MKCSKSSVKIFYLSFLYEKDTDWDRCVKISSHMSIKNWNRIVARFQFFVANAEKGADSVYISIKVVVKNVRFLFGKLV